MILSPTFRRYVVIYWILDSVIGVCVAILRLGFLREISEKPEVQKRIIQVVK
jgi:phosphate/sulfate permease